MRRLEGGGTGAAPASDGRRNLVPGPYSGSLAGHYEPARSDHGQRHKGQDAALARRKARGASQMHLIVRSNPDTPPGVIRAMRLVGAPTPSPEGTEEEECGRPPGPEPQTGADFF